MNNELENNIGIPEALAYEKEYKTLLEQVKGKSTSEKNRFSYSLYRGNKRRNGFINCMR